MNITPNPMHFCFACLPRWGWGGVFVILGCFLPLSTYAAPVAPTTVGAKPQPTTPKRPRELRPGHPLAPGVRLCRKAEWAKARAFFLRLKRTRLLTLPREDRPLLYLFLGLSHIHLLQNKKGKQALESALLLDECTTLPKYLDLSPQIRENFARLQKGFLKLCEQKKLALLKKKLAKKGKKTRRPIKKPTPSQSVGLAAWLVLGSGGLALASAFVSGGLSVSTELQRNELPFTRDGTEKYLVLHQQAEQQALVANVLFVTAGVLLFTGFALQLSQLIQPLLPPEQVPPGKVGPTGAGVVVAPCVLPSCGTPTP